MRLLEFGRDAGGANPRRTTAVPEPAPAVTPALRKGTRPVKQNGKPYRRIFPSENNKLMKPARRSPVDLEALQARIHALEQRVQQQTGRIERRATTADLDQLQLRMRQLERSLNNELWAAKQREHTLLEMLSKPPLKTLAIERIRQLRQSDVPVIMRWLRQEAATWWRDSQPHWWPRFAAAWQESLDQARR